MLGAEKEEHDTPVLEIRNYLAVEPAVGRTSSVMIMNRDKRRQKTLTQLQSLLNRQFSYVKEDESMLTMDKFVQIFSQNEVISKLFDLIDYGEERKLIQTNFIDLLKGKLLQSDKPERGREFVDLLDTLAYVLAGENDLDLQMFIEIFKAKGVIEKLYLLMSTEGISSGISVNKVMSYIAALTIPRRSCNLSTIDWNCIDKNFRDLIKDKTGEMTFEEFKKIVPSKKSFFAKRAFQIFDKDNSGKVSIAEYRETLEQFSNQSVEEKVRFLFQIYDQDNDGMIKLNELKEVLKACMEENGMQFTDVQLDQLTQVLYDDALDSSNQRNSHADGIRYEQLKAQMLKMPGLLENLSVSLERFYLPTVDPKKKKGFLFEMRSKLSWTAFRNNAVFLLFVIVFFCVNVGLFVARAIQFKDEFSFMEGKYLYILARSSGQALNFNCAFVVVLMCRHTLTVLRKQGAANFLPLDNHVYLHKMCGICIVFYGFLHTAMHLINFPLNIADKFVSAGTNTTHTAVEWLFTPTPGMFGLIPGWANLTGWGILIILAIMFICSLPFVRRSGSFEVFYWTHLLYIPFWILLIIHGPRFWKWFAAPGFLFLLEKMYRKYFQLTGHGATYISSAVVFPSRVTHLVIKKPPNFFYHPGDYVFIKIKQIAAFEWHPFTLSSSPELSDYLWLHIRCAGGWTNKLYDNLKKLQAQPKIPAIAINMNLIDSCQNNTNNDHHFLTKTGVIDKPLTRRFSDGPNLALTQPTKRLQRKTIGYGHQHLSVINIPAPMNMISSENDTSTLHKRISRKPVTKTMSTPRECYAPDTVKKAVVQQNSNNCSDHINQTNYINPQDPIEIAVDGPYGAPSSHIFYASHAVLIAAGIGVTPFASILQSIMNRYYASQQICPQCEHCWSSEMPESIMNLKKVDFFWINRDQRSFEWFVNLLSQLEMEQAELGGVMDRFLDLHMYITSALSKTDMKAVGLQMALDLLYANENRDLLTGLKTRTNAGRPNWNKVFQQILDQNKGQVTVFYCGPPQLAKELKQKCDAFGFSFRKEIF